MEARELEPPAVPPAEVFTDTLLGEAYRQPVEALPHPRTGVPLVVPKRIA